MRTPSLSQTTANLLGGNQQKISVAKWLGGGRANPDRRRALGRHRHQAKAYIHQLLRRLANEGTAILLITSDMPEMTTLANRIVVMADYRIKGEIEKIQLRPYGRRIHVADRRRRGGLSLTAANRSGRGAAARRLRLEAERLNEDPCAAPGAMMGGGGQQSERRNGEPRSAVDRSLVSIHCPHRTS